MNETDRSSLSHFDTQSNATSESACAEALNVVLMKVFSSASNRSFPKYGSDAIFYMNLIIFDFDGIAHILDDIKLSCSSGLCNIMTKFLKEHVGPFSHYINENI